MPPDATPILAFDLTTHDGHFMGAATTGCVLYEQDGQRLRARGGHLGPDAVAPRETYERAGHEAQHAFWGMGRPGQSMLHQIAQAVQGG